MGSLLAIIVLGYLVVLLAVRTIESLMLLWKIRESARHAQWMNGLVDIIQVMPTVPDSKSVPQSLKITFFCP